jgi:hypothetical protein
MHEANRPELLAAQTVIFRLSDRTCMQPTVQILSRFNRFAKYMNPMKCIPIKGEKTMRMMSCLEAILISIVKTYNQIRENLFRTTSIHVIITNTSLA